MGIVQYMKEEGCVFYEKIPGKLKYTQPVVGQFCWAPIIHIPEIPQVFDVERNDPRGHIKGKFVIRNMVTTDFKTKGERLPLKMLKLRERQEALIYRASKRPCIVLHHGATWFSDVQKQLKTMGKKHLQIKNVMTLLPLYGAKDDEAHEGGFPPIMVARIRAMMYDQFFFFPKEDCSPLNYDSIGRIDNLQTVVNSYPACDFEPYRVTDDCLAIILGMVKRWFDIESDEDLQLICLICNDACPDEYLPSQKEKKS